MNPIPNKELIADSLDRLASQVGDPASLVYDRLFLLYPDLQSLFEMDTDGGVRGSMLQQGFECLLDLAEGGHMAETIIPAERTNHDSYSVPDGLFAEFFEVIRDVTQSVLGQNWNAEHDTAWRALLERAEALSALEAATD